MAQEQIENELFLLKYRLYYCRDAREAMSIRYNMAYYESLLKEKEI
jgi:hypothetical protein